MLPLWHIPGIASGHAFQNASHLNAPLLCQVMLFKMPAIWMHLYCARSHFSKCQPFECTSIASGQAFQNAHPLNQDVSDCYIRANSASALLRRHRGTTVDIDILCLITFNTPFPILAKLLFGGPLGIAESRPIGFLRYEDLLSVSRFSSVHYSNLEHIQDS
jgi:hypothetical protein